MSDIAKLTVALYANSAQFTSEMGKSRKTANHWSESVSKAANIAAKATVAAAVTSSGALALIYKEQAAVIDQTAKFADRIGISTEALTQFHHASELTGVGTKNLDMSLQRMTRRIAEAAQGSGEAAPALEQLGLDAQKLGEMTPDEQLHVLADAFTEVEDQSERVRLAFKLFDSEGVGMVNMLAGGSAGLREMANEADQLGITLSRIDAAKVEAANDSMYKIGAITSSMSKELTTQLAPIVEAVANEFVTAAKNAGGFNVVMADTIETVVTGFGWMGTALHGWEVMFATLEFRTTELAYTIQSSIQSASDFVHEAGKTMFSPMMEGIWQALDSLGTFSDTAQQAAENLRLAMDAPSPKVFDDLPNITLEYSQARWELQKLLAEPLPHDQADAWLKRVRENAEKAAQAIANTRNTNLGGLDTGSGDTKEKPAVTSFRKANDQIAIEWQRRLAIDAAGQNTAYAQESFAYADRAAQLSQQFQSAYQAAANNLQLQNELENAYFASRETLWRDHQANLTQIEKDEADKRKAYQSQVAANLLTFTQQQLSITLGAIKDAQGESSALYKALFFAQKAAAIPSMIVATESAATQAMAAFPGPGGLALAGTVRALGYSSVGIAAGQAIAGMAHDGSSGFRNGRIPREGTWLLDGGEKVQTRPEADRHERALSMIENGQYGGAAGGHPQVTIYQTIQANGDEKIVAMIEQASHQAIEAAYNKVDQDFRTGRGIRSRLQR